jgi:hypothetical protein
MGKTPMRLYENPEWTEKRRKIKKRVSKNKKPPEIISIWDDLI